ncbi:hypothetical protein T11_1768 [Trichinella zimbabwensis]|uniref:Uncharacterized protein n=1 Tax=Trichinella zimbabwensis TaxID=268475 RepID=A0A0V1HV24_9BILA|nr:hypothetical protein T11_1768 [Trichinella zimbabwensis]
MIQSCNGDYELHVNFNRTAVIYVNRIFTSAFVIRGNSHIYYNIFRSSINVQRANCATLKDLHKVDIAISYLQNPCKYLPVNF